MQPKNSIKKKAFVSILLFILLFLGAWVFHHKTFRFHFIEMDQEQDSYQPMNIEPLSKHSIPQNDARSNIEQEEEAAVNKIIVPYYKPREYIRIYRDEHPSK